MEELSQHTKNILGLQLPTDPRLIDLKRAAESQTYCDEIKGQAGEHGVQIIVDPA